MSDSWDYGQGALAFFERLRSVVAKEDLPAYLHEAFERRQTEQNRNVCDAAVAAKEDDDRSNEIHAFVKATFGDVTRDETAFFYNTIREEFRRGGDRFVGYLTKLEEYTRRFFGFQGNYHLGEFSRNHRRPKDAKSRKYLDMDSICMACYARTRKGSAVN